MIWQINFLYLQGEMMRNIRKAIIVVFSLNFITIFSAENPLKADEQKGNPQRATSAPRPMVAVSSTPLSEEQRHSALSQSPIGKSPVENMYVVGVPTWTGFTNYVSNSWGSFTETVKNRASDDAAFSKLGWPPSDPVAQNELKKTLDKYKDVVTEPIFELRCKDLDTICNRVNYLIRVYKALYPTESSYGKCMPRSDGVPLVKHCMKQHLGVIPDPLKSLFSQYLMEKEVEAIDANNSAKKVWPNHPSESHSIKTENFSGSAHLENNEASNIEILVKIGWPCAGREKDAHNYLQTCLAIYQVKQLLRTIKGREALQTPEGRASLKILENAKIVAIIQDSDYQRKFIAARQEYIKKIYNMLPTRPDGLEIAAHCLEKHAYILSKSDEDNYIQFIEDKQKKTSAIAEQFIPQKADTTNVAGKQ
jgi:hypothetical protein